MSLYRAARLANATELRVVKQKVRGVGTSFRSSHLEIGYSETTEVSVRFVRGPADRDACEEKDAGHYLTVPVALLLWRYGPEQAMPVARSGDAPAEPARIVASAPMFGPAARVPPAPRGSFLAAMLVGARHCAAEQPATSPAPAAPLPVVP